MPKNKLTRVDWSGDNITLLMRLFDDGLSCALIAEQIPGATRNSVIGKLNRMKVSRKTTATKTVKSRNTHKGVRRVPLHAKSQRLKGPNGIPSWCRSQIPYQEITVMPVVDDSCKPLHPRSFHDLDDDMCRWPLYVEQGVQMFCAAHIDQPRTPYCRAHCSASTAVLRPRTNRVYTPHRSRT